MKKITSWILENKLEAVVLALIIIATVFLRFYKLPDYMAFLGDEGRDALVIKGILVDHHFPLLGPASSVGNLYLGPLYYYMMASAMAIFWLSPVAAAGMVALIGTLTVILVYVLARAWFGKWPAAVSALLYSTSFVNIIYSRSSWNPDPAPFFALLSIIGLYLARIKNNYFWLVLTGGALAFTVQMHYLALILIPVLGLLWLIEVFKVKNKHHFAMGSFLAMAAFLILMSPLVIFDLRHNMMNWRSFQALFSDTNSIGASQNNLLRIFDIYVNSLVGRYLAGGQIWLGYLMAMLVVVPFIFKRSWKMLALGVWLVIGLLGVSFYKGPIYDHYLGFMNPVPFLLLGAGVSLITKLDKPALKNLAAFLVGLLLAMLLAVNWQKNILLTKPNNQLKRTQDVAKFIIQKSDNQPFNFALLAARNYDSAYQFYLWRYGHQPKVVPFDITGQLFVVCEDPVCQPVNNPKQEISAYGWSKIDSEVEFEGVKVFRLIPNPSGKPQ